MPELKTEVTVCAEKVIHDSIKELLQHFSDKYGIQVKDIHADYMDVSTFGHSGFNIIQLTVKDFIK